METAELRDFRRALKEFQKKLRTKQDCVRALQRAGILDQSGKLAAPYRPAAVAKKS